MSTREPNRREPLFECVDCGARVTAPDGRLCSDCGGYLGQVGGR